MSKQVAAVLRRARARLVKYGWLQNAEYGHRKRGPFCAERAITMAANTTETEMLAAAALERVIGGRVIPAWNDARGRTKRQVLAAFDRAIKTEGTSC